MVTKYIYMTTNIENGMIYIGQHFDYNKTGIDSYLGSGKHLGCAIKKYGKDNFFKRIIKIYETDEELNIAEKYWITYYRGLGYVNKTMYNIADGGNCANNFAFKTDEEMDIIKAKISKIHTGKTLTDEAKAKMSKARLGKPMSDATKAKISKAGKGHQNNLGYTHTDDAKAKISKAKLGKLHTDDAKAKMSKARIGKTASDEARANMSKAHSNQKRDPFYYNDEYFPNKTVCRKKYFPELTNEQLKKYMKENPENFKEIKQL